MNSSYQWQDEYSNRDINYNQSRKEARIQGKVRKELLKSGKFWSLVFEEQICVSGMRITL